MALVPTVHVGQRVRLAVFVRDASSFPAVTAWLEAMGEVRHLADFAAADGRARRDVAFMFDPNGEARAAEGFFVDDTDALERLRSARIAVATLADAATRHVGEPVELEAYDEGATPTSALAQVPGLVREAAGAVADRATQAAESLRGALDSVQTGLSIAATLALVLAGGLVWALATGRLKLNLGALELGGAA